MKSRCSADGLQWGWNIVLIPFIPAIPCVMISRACDGIFDGTFGCRFQGFLMTALPLLNDILAAS
jgi:hypothetical protein